MRRWLKALLFRFQPVWSRQRIESELSEELRIHLEMATAANIAAGMPPEAARRAAQLELGGVEQVKEAWREQRGLPWLDHLARDIAYAARQLRNQPGFTAVVTLSLALSIGASTAIFSIANEVLLKPLPVKNPGELVHLGWSPGVEGGKPRNYSAFGDVAPFSLRTFEWFRAARPAALADLFAYTVVRGPIVTLNGQPEIAGAAYVVSGNYYQALGIGAIQGRVLGPEDDRLDAVPAVVLSHRYWQSRFGGDPAIVGRSLEVNKVPVTVIGITAPGFGGVLSSVPADLTVPLAMAPLLVPDGRFSAAPDTWWLRVGGRLRPGATPEQARASLEGPFRASARDALTKVNDFPRLELTPAGSGRSDEERKNLTKAVVPRAAMAGLLLIAACANVANLLLARAAARRREMDVRIALGATGRRLFAQLLVESTLLSALGAGVGTAFALWGTDLLWYGRGEHFGFDPRVLAFTVIIALLTGIGFGLVPAARAIGANFTADLGGRQTGGPTRPRLGRFLMAGQVAISFVLLVGAGLLIRSLHNLRSIDIGFSRGNLLLFSVDGLSTGHTVPDLVTLYTRIADRLAGRPGVRSVTFSRVPLLSGFANGRAAVSVSPGPPSPASPGALTNQVSRDFFATYDIPIIMGRGFREGDFGAPVTVINHEFARAYFGDSNPLGRNIYRNGTALEVVGVAGDIRLYSLRLPVSPTFFTPSGPKQYGAAHFAIRLADGFELDPGSLREMVLAIDPNLPLANVRQQGAEIERQLLNDRVFVQLGSFFGFVALALACVGLYGLASYSVHSRIREFGIRTALGAVPGHLLRLVLRESLDIALAGTLLGAAVSVAATRLLAGQLYGLSAADPATYGTVALLLLVIAVFAALRPARRAAKVDPMIALRCE